MNSSKQTLGFSTALAAVLLWAPLTHAAGLITITRSIAMPSDVVAGNAPAEAQYTVTNNFGFDLPAVQLQLPAGVVEAPPPPPIAGNLDTGFCDFPSALANGASCILRLQYSGFVGDTVSDNTFRVCPDSSGKYCSAMSDAQAQATTVIETPTANMPSLTASVSRVVLAPEQTTTIHVTNNSSNVTANNIGIALSDAMKSYLEDDSVLSCPTTAPGATCDLTLRAKSDLPITVTNRPVVISGSNTQVNNLLLSTAATRIYIPAVVLSDTTATPMTITNHTGGNISISSVDLPGTISNVTVGSVSGCASVADEASCTVNLTAATNAIGSGNAAVEYLETAEPVNATVTVPVIVARTTVAINPNSSNVGQNIQGSQSGAGSFTIKNTGNFVWRNPSVTRDSADSPWLTLSSGCTAGLNPGASCTVNYTVDTPDYGHSSIITAAGDNISNTSQDFIPNGSVSIGLALGPDQGVDYQHFAARALRISNLTLQPITLTNIVANPPSALSGKVTLCNATGSNCTGGFASDCLTSPGSKVLAANANCKIFYEASTAGSSIGDTSANATISLKANGRTLSRAIQFNYGSDLYAGGFFTSASGTAVGGFARWNGSSWSAISSTADTTSIQAATIFKDDLMAGGYFSGFPASTGAVGRWNGSQWQIIASNANGVVRALAVFGGQLYAGGNQVLNATTNLASWNGSVWNTSSNVNGPVNSLTAADYLYAGGTFSVSISGGSVMGIARWNGSRWSVLSVSSPPRGTNGPVEVTKYFQSIPFIGGTFLQIDNKGSLSAPVAWALGSGVATYRWRYLTPGLYINNSNTPGATYAITPVSNFGVYIGGQFNLAGTLGVNNLVFCDWTSSSTPDPLCSVVGNGVNNTVFTSLRVGSDVYFGGKFTTAGGSSVNGIAKWNGSAWSPLGTGVSGSTSVKSLAVLPSLVLATVDTPSQARAK